MLKRTLIILAHAFIGWAICGAIMGIGMNITTMQNTLIAHAIGGPVAFGLIAWFYFKKFNYTGPLQTAIIFISFVILVDFFLVALMINKSLDMFRSPLGTWIPFTLIFLVVWGVGKIIGISEIRKR
jgi:hypothetical protein